jgi:polyisoprenoid-binding protein YceI
MTRDLHRAWLSIVLGVAGALGVAAPVTPITLEIDPASSEVVFHLRTTWHGVEGRAGAIRGSVTSESGDLLGDGRVSVEIEAAALDTGNSRRDRTMRDSHLETGKHPKITFTSTGPPAMISSTRNAAGAWTDAYFTVPGSLAIHGVTRAVAPAVTARREGDAWRMEGELPVKLTEYAIPDPSIFFNHVQDDVKVILTITLRPQPAPPTEPRPRGR